MLIAARAETSDSKLSTKHIECTNEEGSPPSQPAVVLGTAYKESYSIARCPSESTLTGCGLIPVANDPNLKGTSIEQDDTGRTACKAWTHLVANAFPPGGGVRAIARCCNFNQSVSSFVNTEVSIESKATEGAVAFVSCPEESGLIGCTGHSWGPIFNGVYAGLSIDEYGEDTLDTCTAVNGMDTWAAPMGMYYYNRGSYATARCANSALLSNEYNLECMQEWGDPSETSSVVECPSTYFMTSCNAYDEWSAFGQYVIDDDDVCTVTHTGAVSGDMSVASAICCRLSKEKEGEEDNSDGNTHENGHGLSMREIYLIGTIAILVVIACAICCGCLVMHKKRYKMPKIDSSCNQKSNLLDLEDKKQPTKCYETND